ncbi:hypothetical protein [Halobellus captivus]|uniref:hypothetical protein n=1 Tax=Halobellus captivus TaxID=2592614 RepID=UPI0011A0E903|nr:hypothetical protein [Halobellus captivus]
MSTSRTPGTAGTVARVVVGVCFVAGAVLAVTGRLVVAGVAFLAGHTFLATAAVIQGQRRRGAGLSLSGVGWLVLSVGLGASGAEVETGVPGTPLLVAGFVLVTVGTVLVVSALESGGTETTSPIEK